jgi:hypothetical protein
VIEPIGCPPKRKILKSELEPERLVNAPRELGARRAKTKEIPASPATPNEVQPIESLLPGSNPYDKAVQRGIFTYAEAKQREEAALVGERIKQAQIATEQAQIALDKEKLDLQEKKRDLISVSDYVARQELVIGTFQELLRLVVSESVLAVPANQRDEIETKLGEKVRAAMSTIAQSVLSMKPRDAVIQEMLEAFKNS